MAADNGARCGAVQGTFALTQIGPGAIQRLASGLSSGPAAGDGLQGAAADCNSAEETHAWFDSRVAHHSSGAAGQALIRLQSGLATQPGRIRFFAENHASGGDIVSKKEAASAQILQ